MKPVHSMLEPLEQLAPMLEKKICFISMQTSDLSGFYRWLPWQGIQQFAYQQLKHCEMAWEVLVAKDVDFFLVYEFNGPYVLPILAALALRRKPSFLIMHGVQQLSARSPFHEFGFRMVRFMVRRCNAYAVHLELTDDCLPPDRRMPRDKSIVIPLTHRLASAHAVERRLRAPNDPIRIGVVGMLRKDKRTKEIIEHLIRNSKSIDGPFHLLFGTPFWQKEEWVDQLGIEIRDTSNEDEYNGLLRDLDVLVYDSLESEYYFRPSGVIGDALMNGCCVVCPDFPVFKTQVENPVGVGRTFPNMERLIDTINLACEDVRSGLTERFAEWRKLRSMDRVAGVFSKVFSRIEKKDTIPLIHLREPTGDINVPLVTMIIPAYNAAEFIVEAIVSVSKQTYQNIELIVVDDGSTDETYQRAKDALTGLRNAAIYRKSNGGVSSARNLGALRSHQESKYLFFLDADDMLLAQAAELMVAYLEEHPEVGLLGCQFDELIHKQNIRIPAHRSRMRAARLFPRDMPDTEYETPFEVFYCATGQGPFAMYRKSTWLKTNGWSEDLWGHNDTDMFIQMALEAPVHYIPARLYIKRRTAIGLMSRPGRDLLYSQLREKWDNYQSTDQRKMRMLAKAKMHYYRWHKPFRNLKVGCIAFSQFLSEPSMAKLNWSFKLLIDGSWGLLNTIKSCLLEKISCAPGGISE